LIVETKNFALLKNVVILFETIELKVIAFQLLFSVLN